jgi:hypothetical protein
MLVAHASRIGLNSTFPWRLGHSQVFTTSIDWRLRAPGADARNTSLARPSCAPIRGPHRENGGVGERLKLAVLKKEIADSLSDRKFN